MLQNGYRALYDFSDTFPFMTRIRASSEHEFCGQAKHTPSAF